MILIVVEALKYLRITSDLQAACVTLVYHTQSSMGIESNHSLEGQGT